MIYIIGIIKLYFQFSLQTIIPNRSGFPRWNESALSTKAQKRYPCDFIAFVPGKVKQTVLFSRYHMQKVKAERREFRLEPA